MRLIKNYYHDPKLRKSMSELATLRFGLDFEKLYQMGYWSERFSCYGFENQGDIIANVSFHELEIVRDGEIFTALQIGTVMTAPNYEGQGLAKKLMLEVLSDFEHKDVIYLFGNENVMEFYPKFGFEHVEHIKFSQTKAIPKYEKLPVTQLSLTSDLALLDRYIKDRIQNSPHDYVLNDDYLKMFYALYLYENNVYQVNDVVIICEKDNDTLWVHDVYSNTEIDYEKVLAPFTENVLKIKYGFEPKLPHLNCRTDENSGLFVKTKIISLKKPWFYPTTSVT